MKSMAENLNKIKDIPNSSERISRLKWIRRFAYLLDNSIPIPWTGRRFGLDAIIGLVPGLGDAVGAILSGYILLEARRLGAPRKLLLDMVYNVAVEAIVGAVPIAGDVLDAAWKANTRNIALLDKYFDSIDGKKSER